jgi:hypothetical protein
MNFRCPNPVCGAGVRLGEPVCPQCGQSLSFVAVLRFTLKGWWGWVKNATQTRCPGCRAVIPLREALCPRCGQPVTFAGAVNATIAPGRRAAGKVLREMSPEAQSGVRWSYVVFSALVFWMLVLRVERSWNNDWYGYAAVSVVYLAFLYLIFLWVVPGSLRAKVGRRIRMATKLAAIFNFFSLLLLLLLFIARFWGQANKIALVFGISFAAFWVVSSFLRGLWAELALDWMDVPPTFNHLGNQGRGAYRDFRD